MQLTQASKVFGLDDNAGTIKMIYSILARAELLHYVSYGVNGADFPKVDGSIPDREMTVADTTQKIDEMIKKDPFLLEQASRMIAARELHDPEALFASCTTFEEVQAQDTSLAQRISHTKTAVATIRRNMKDII